MAHHPWDSSYSPVAFYGLVQGRDPKMLFHYMDGNAIEITNKGQASFLGSCCPFAVCSMLYRTWVSSSLIPPMFLCVCGLGSFMWTLHSHSSIITSSGCGYSFKLSGRLVFGLPAVIKLLLQCIRYCVWRERNMHTFQQASTTETGVIARVDRIRRDRLISIPPSSASSPSPLLVYFRLPPPVP